MTYEQLQAKMQKLYQASADVMNAKSNLHLAEVALKSEEFEIANRFLTDEAKKFVEPKNFYLIGRQISKALPHPIG